MHLGLRLSWTRKIPAIKHSFILSHVISHNLQYNIKMAHDNIFVILGLSKERKILSNAHTKNIGQLPDKRPKLEHTLA